MRQRLGSQVKGTPHGILEYPCQGKLLLWRKIYVSEEKDVVLEEDKIRECSRVNVVPCRGAVQSQQSRKRIDRQD